MGVQRQGSGGRERHDSQGAPLKFEPFPLQIPLAALVRLDAAAIRILLDEARRTLGLMVCVDDGVLPAMRQIGVWTVGQRDFDQERLCTEDG